MDLAYFFSWEEWFEWGGDADMMMLSLTCLGLLL